MLLSCSLHYIGVKENGGSDLAAGLQTKKYRSSFHAAQAHKYSGPGILFGGERRHILLDARSKGEEKCALVSTAPVYSR